MRRKKDRDIEYSNFCKKDEGKEHSLVGRKILAAIFLCLQSYVIHNFLYYLYVDKRVNEYS
jgi:hypothetical protein